MDVFLGTIYKHLKNIMYKSIIEVLGDNNATIF